MHDIFFTGTAVLVVIRIVNEGPAVLFLDFYVILIFTDLTKMLVGGILKERMTVCMINSYTRQTVESRF